MNLDIFKIPDPSGKMSKESYVEKYHKDEFDFITKSIAHNLPFKEKVYLVINNLTEIPICKNPNCDNKVKFKNSNIGYSTYCSNKCIGTDPEMIQQKQNKSIEKFGTRTPAESQIIKNKIINTNKKKYGGHSPMTSDETKKKSRNTLNKNWGVDNPAKSDELLEKRISSFKENIDSYKESYKKTSLDKYGVEHPWMCKEIHKKTIDHFHKSYKDRIISLTPKDIDFIDFKKNISTNLIFFCNKCNSQFDILTYQFYWRINNNHTICTNCAPISESSSLSQKEVFDFIKSNYDGPILENDRSTIKPYEIDIYLPELKLGFEFNGVFWHSDKFKDKDYHKKKYNISNGSTIGLYTIWEDDWNLKRDICKSFVLNKINKSKKILARKTIIRPVDYKMSKIFLDDNHFQGDCKSSVRLGLFIENQLVSLMTFSKLRLPVGGKNKQDTYELTRFCSLKFHTVVGGASKLFNHFIKTYSPSEVQTYSDNLISNGKLYETLNFKYSHTSEPGYWYVIDGIKSHRFNWRKQKLVSMGYDKNKTEEQIMNEMNYYKVYNAGNKKWIWRP
jgi:hypothetical protein